MDFKTAYTHDLLTQAEQCFSDKELPHSFLKFIFNSSKNRQEAERKLKALRARIFHLEDMAKNSYNMILDMQRTAQQEEYELDKKQRQVFGNSEIYDFFIDSKNDEFIAYLKEMAPLERINTAIKQFETMRARCDSLIDGLRKSYPMKSNQVITQTPQTSPKAKTNNTLQLDRGLYLNNTGRF